MGCATLCLSAPPPTRLVHPPCRAPPSPPPPPPLPRLRIDDPLDAAPVHFFCGAWGVLSVGFFATEVRPEGGEARAQGGGGAHFLCCRPGGRGGVPGAPTHCDWRPRHTRPSPLPRHVQTGTTQAYTYANDWGVFYGGQGYQLGVQVGWMGGGEGEGNRLATTRAHRPSLDHSPPHTAHTLPHTRASPPTPTHPPPATPCSC